ncbi:MAG: glutaredoxin 3 [Sphingomonadales bacterium]|nr:glutaredoxin 3 [Sphingomonadales bacterium]
MAKVEIYTARFCPYCTRAIALLNAKGVGYNEIKVDGAHELRQKMTRRAHGGSSVPQIFIDGEHVGGCDEMYALDRSGALDVMLG